jgi:hypothetical protein
MEVDAVRQDMFGLRDELFSLAESGVTRFNSIAYRTLREQLNAYIRFADRCDPLWLLLSHGWISYEHAQSSANQREERWAAGLLKESDESVRALRLLRAKAQLRIILHLLAIAPHQTMVLAMVLVPYFSFVLARDVAKHHMRIRLAASKERIAAIRDVTQRVLSAADGELISA